jgi:hypothetical protein
VLPLGWLVPQNYRLSYSSLMKLHLILSNCEFSWKVEANVFHSWTSKSTYNWSQAVQQLVAWISMEGLSLAERIRIKVFYSTLGFDSEMMFRLLTCGPLLSLTIGLIRQQNLKSDNNHHLGRNSGPNVNKNTWVCTCVFACIMSSWLDPGRDHGDGVTSNYNWRRYYNGY